MIESEREMERERKILSADSNLENRCDEFCQSLKIHFESNAHRCVCNNSTKKAVHFSGVSRIENQHVYCREMKKIPALISVRHRYKTHTHTK